MEANRRLVRERARERPEPRERGGRACLVEAPDCGGDLRPRRRAGRVARQPRRRRSAESGRPSRWSATPYRSLAGTPCRGVAREGPELLGRRQLRRGPPAAARSRRTRARPGAYSGWSEVPGGDGIRRVRLVAPRPPATRPPPRRCPDQKSATPRLSWTTRAVAGAARRAGSGGRRSVRPARRTPPRPAPRASRTARRSCAAAARSPSCTRPPRAQRPRLARRCARRSRA